MEINTRQVHSEVLIKSLKFELIINAQILYNQLKDINSFCLSRLPRPHMD